MLISRNIYPSMNFVNISDCYAFLYLCMAANVLLINFNAVCFFFFYFSFFANYAFMYVSIYVCMLIGL